MGYVRFRGERVSRAHFAMLSEYERRRGAAVQINDGARTIAEQWDRYRHYQRYGSPVAAYPNPGAPHIKYGRAHHALDINGGSDPGESYDVAAFYRARGVSVAFNVRNEPWHMDTLDRRALIRAAHKTGFYDPVLKPGAKRNAVLHLKRLMYAKGLRDFERRTRRYGPKAVAAVKRFQKKHNLRADGIVGPKTWRALHA